MPLLTHNTCFQNNEAMSSYVGLAAEMCSGTSCIKAMPSNEILSTSLIVLKTVQAR